MEMNKKILIKGVEDLSVSEKKIVEGLIKKHYDKLVHKYDLISEIIVHLKSSHTLGVNKKHSVEVEVFLESRRFAGDSEDWNLKTAIHDSFNKIDEQISKGFNR